MFRLDDKTALVTGASQGIGRAIAQKFSEQGARVIIAARSADKLEAFAEELRQNGGEAHPLVLDLSQPTNIGQTLGQLPPEYADIDILVNNAGITRDGLMARMSLEQWEDVLRTNLTGAFVVTRELLRPMLRKRWGRILFISSVTGLMGNPGQTNYAAAKAGMIGFSKSLAREIGGRNITVNVIAPGLIETAMTEKIDEKARKQLTDNIVLRRMGTSDEIAAAAVFLASSEASYITGEVLNVSGGLYI